MNIVVIGKSGQLAFELSREFENSSHQVTFIGRDDIDITNSDIIGASLAPLSPDVLINASAYTAVDKAEEDADACNAINAVAVKNLAIFCKARGAFMVHVSTDYVYAGSGDHLWAPDAATAPINAYGRTKLAGDQAVAEAGGAHAILRTSWVVSAHGHNFIKTMLRPLLKVENHILWKSRSACSIGFLMAAWLTAYI